MSLKSGLLSPYLGPLGYIYQASDVTSFLQIEKLRLHPILSNLPKITGWFSLGLLIPVSALSVLTAQCVNQIQET